MFTASEISEIQKLLTSDSKIVIISHDKTQQIVPSKEATVGDLLKKLNLKLNEGDVVEPASTGRDAPIRWPQRRRAFNRRPYLGRKIKAGSGTTRASGASVR